MSDFPLSWLQELLQEQTANELVKLVASCYSERLDEDQLLRRIEELAIKNALTESDDPP